MASSVTVSGGNDAVDAEREDTAGVATTLGAVNIKIENKNRTTQGRMGWNHDANTYITSRRTEHQ